MSTKMWDFIYLQLEQKTLAPAKLRNFEHLIDELMIIKSDHLNNNLLNYAMIYKNLILIGFIFSKSNFNNFSNKIKKKITDDIFSHIVIMTRHLSQNFSYLENFFNILTKSSFKEVGNTFVLQDPPKIFRLKKKQSNGQISLFERAEKKISKLFLSIFFLIFQYYNKMNSKISNSQKC